MGIEIDDVIEYDIGVSMAGTYASFGNDSIRCIQSSNEGEDYRLNSMAKVWANEAARNSNSNALQLISVSIGITIGQLDGNLYTLLYDELKLNYTSTQDK